MAVDVELAIELLMLMLLQTVKLNWYFNLALNARFYLINRVLILILEFNWKLLLSF